MVTGYGNRQSKSLSYGEYRREGGQEFHSICSGHAAPAMLRRCSVRGLRRMGKRNTPRILGFPHGLGLEINRIAYQLTNSSKQTNGCGDGDRGVRFMASPPPRLALRRPALQFHMSNVLQLAYCTPDGIGKSGAGVYPGLCRFHASTSAQTIRNLQTL